MDEWMESKQKHNVNPLTQCLSNVIHRLLRLAPHQRDVKIKNFLYESPNLHREIFTEHSTDNPPVGRGHADLEMKHPKMGVGFTQNVLPNFGIRKTIKLSNFEFLTII